MTALRQKNEELLSEKINGESQLIHILENLEEAETVSENGTYMYMKGKEEERVQYCEMERK